MGKIETRKRDCRRSVGIKYKIKPLKKWRVCIHFSAMGLFCDEAKDLRGERRRSNATLF